MQEFTLYEIGQKSVFITVTLVQFLTSTTESPSSRFFKIFWQVCSWIILYLHTKIFFKVIFSSFLLFLSISGLAPINSRITEILNIFKDIVGSLHSVLKMRFEFTNGKSKKYPNIQCNNFLDLQSTFINRFQHVHFNKAYVCIVIRL